MNLELPGLYFCPTCIIYNRTDITNDHQLHSLVLHQKLWQGADLQTAVGPLQCSARLIQIAIYLSRILETESAEVLNAFVCRTVCHDGWYSKLLFCKWSGDT